MGAASSGGEVEPSSAARHLAGRDDSLVQAHPAYWALGNTPFEREAAFRRLLDEGLPRERAQALADAARKAWALGDAAFLQALQKGSDRPLQPRPRGRPRKAAPE